MRTAADKVELAKSSAASAAAKTTTGSVAAALPDRRPAAAAQHQLQAGIVASPRQEQAATLQRIIDSSPRQQAAPAPLQKKENKTGLPDELKAGVENLSGYSLDDVQVHYNSAKPAELQAHAYAQGSAIHVAPGQERHLPHEAWHVVQQKQGQVRPTMQLKGEVAVNDDTGLEREAEVMGTQALVQRQTQPARGLGGRITAKVYQLAGKYEGRMARHDTYEDSYEFGGGKNNNFTYHHIIPENKIHGALKKIEAVVDAEDKVKTLKEGIGAHAKSQFTEAMVKDTAFYISKEINNFATNPVITLSESEAREVISAEHSDRTLVINGIRDILQNKLSCLEASTNDEVLKERAALGEKLQEKEFGEKIIMYAMSGIDAEDRFTEGAVWMPGNIHRGPKSSYRLDPKNKKQFKEWQDDGGDRFEKAAANIVSVEHYGKLWKLDAEMTKLIGLPVPKATDEMGVAEFRAQVVVVLEGMDAIRKLPTTNFNKSQWKAHQVGAGDGITTNFMRLEPHEPEDGGERRLEEAKKLG